MYTHTTRKTQEPRITMTVGTTLFPRPREAAMVQSINAEMGYDQPIMRSRSIPASTTSASFAKRERNSRPNTSSSPPSSAPAAKEYVRPTK